jgi:hypothetical protein
MISGIWGTTQSESITLPQNNDKLLSTNVHITLKQYPGFDLPQTMREMTSNLRSRWCWCWGWWWWCHRCDGDAPPYAKEESMVLMAVISLQWLQQFSPSRGGRRVPPPPPPQKITRKLGHLFSDDTESSLRRRRWGDHRGPNGPRWRGLPGWPRHLVSFRPRGPFCVLRHLQVLFV